METCGGRHRQAGDRTGLRSVFIVGLRDTGTRITEAWRGWLTVLVYNMCEEIVQSSTDEERSRSPRVPQVLRTLNRNVDIADWPTGIEGANADQVVTTHIVLLQRILPPSTRIIPVKSADQRGSLVQGDGP